ncbi:MAG: cell division protein FtsB [Gammaproteobacteria bacterium]|nr:cell division protein FtsB [Gammaproteobacteria bacterium]
MRASRAGQLGPKIIALGGIAVLGILLASFWFGESGWFAVRDLERDVALQDSLTQRLEHRNRLLAAEVMMLKEGNEVVEARARSELGMVAEGETFYLVVDEEEEPRP